MGRVADLRGSSVYFDANVFIYLIEGFAPTTRQVETLADAIDRREMTVVTSELSVLEVLVGPRRAGNVQLENAYRVLLQSSKIRIAPIESAVIEEAVALRSSSSLKVPDALHLATAVIAGCNTFLSNDRQLRSVSTIPLQLIDELTP